MLSLDCTVYHIGVLVLAFDVVQDCLYERGNWNASSPGLRVGQGDVGAVQEFPLQSLDFAEAAAGEQ